VRYDFFYSLIEILKLNPWDIQLEHPIHSESFIPRENAKRKRDEKPQIDLWVEKGDIRICFEFAIFKRNKVDRSPINDTEYAFKVLNDFLRLGLHAYLTRSEAYFVCVADAMMLGRQLSSKKIPAFPGGKYEFNHLGLTDIMVGYISSKKIDIRFHSKLKEHNLKIKADLVFNELLESALNKLETRVLIWKITPFNETQV